MIFDPKDIRFTPAGIGSLTDEELRAAYEDLSGNAKSELNRIKRSKVFGDAAVVERNKDYYPSSKKIDSYYNPRRELEWRTVEAAAQLRSERGTLGGLYRIRDKQIAALHEAGYTKINRRNYRQAVEWLTANDAGFLPSDQILDTFNALPQKTKLEAGARKITDTANFKKFAASVASAEARRFAGSEYKSARADIRKRAKLERGKIASAYFAAVVESDESETLDAVTAAKIRSQLRREIYGNMGRSKGKRKGSR